MINILSSRSERHVKSLRTVIETKFLYEYNWKPKKNHPEAVAASVSSYF